MSARHLDDPNKFIVEAKGLQAVASFKHPEGAYDVEGGEALLLAPGLGSPELEELRNHMSSLGHAAISLEQPRAGYMHLFGDVGELRSRILEDAANKAMAKYNIGKIAYVGHSLGGIDVVKTVQMVDDSATISSVELMASAGLTGESFMRIARRLHESGIEEIMKGRGGSRSMGRIAVNVMRNPLQLLAEGRYGQNSTITEDIKKLLDEDVDVSLTQFEDDKVFPTKLVDPRIEELIESGLWAVKAGKKTLLDSCHIAPFCDPEGTATVLHHKVLARRDDIGLPAAS